MDFRNDERKEKFVNTYIEMTKWVRGTRLIQPGLLTLVREGV